MYDPQIVGSICTLHSWFSILVASHLCMMVAWSFDLFIKSFLAYPEFILSQSSLLLSCIWIFKVIFKYVWKSLTAAIPGFLICVWISVPYSLIPVTADILKPRPLFNKTCILYDTQALTALTHDLITPDLNFFKLHSCTWELFLLQP